jgi:hypothetical protein
MPRLNDPGMDRPDGNFMHLLSLDAIKRINPSPRPEAPPAGSLSACGEGAFGGDRPRSYAGPQISNIAIILMITYRFKPGMPDGHNGKLLRDLPLEHMRLGKFKRQGSKRRFIRQDAHGKN